MTKIAFFADAHLCYRQYNLQGRRDDFRDAYLETCRFIRDSDVDVVLIGGDLFHALDISPLEYATAVEGLPLLSSSEVIIVPGNHDKALRSRDGLWLERLADEGLLTVLGAAPDKDWEIYDTGKLVVIGVPYHGWRTREVVRELSKRSLSSLDPTYILAHLGVSDVCMNVPATVSAAELEALFGTRVQAVLTGHFHYPWSNGYVYSPGSLEKTDILQPPGGIWFFGEGEPKFVAVTEYHTPRQFFMFRCGNLNGALACSSQFDLTDSITRFTFTESVPSMVTLIQALEANCPWKVLVTSKVVPEEFTGIVLDGSSVDLEWAVFEKLLPGYADIVSEVKQLSLTGSSEDVVDYVLAQVDKGKELGL